MKILPVARMLLLVVGFALVAPRSNAREPDDATFTKVSPSESLRELKGGNQRYVSGKLNHPRRDSDRRDEVAASQHPFAIVLGCADSRTPPEVLFDQGLGDLFVVRVAGNVLDDNVLGSIEYAVEHFHTGLVVVLGHQRCGAVKAAKDTIAAGATAPPHIDSLVRAIQPVIEANPKADLDETVKANILYVAKTLRATGPVLKAKNDTGKIVIVGAYYSLDTGKVVFLDAGDSDSSGKPK
jgi:carbonic anhydrase